MVRKNNFIYVIDDDDSVRKAIRRLLVSSGYAVETFHSARNFLDSIPIDTEGLIILDVCMPEMDGYAFMQRLRDLRSTMRIILFTGYAEAVDRKRAFDLGAIGFLKKPFSEQSLLDLIKAEEEERNA